MPPLESDGESEYVQIAEAPINEAKRMQETMQTQGVELHLASNPDDCSSCSPKIAVFVKLTDLEKFKTVVQAAGGLTAGNGEAAFDSEKEEATCPACGTVFSTQLTECPDCGLGFGVA